MRLLVVGGTAGIGREVTVLARTLDWPVVAAGRTGDGRIDVRIDVADPGSVTEGVARAADRMGGIDAVVHAAGRADLATLQETGPAAWAEALGVNLVGAALTVEACRAYLPAGDGRVVLLGSDAALRPPPHLVPYAVAKAGLRAFAAGLAAECPELRVSHVTVGPTRTGFADGWPADRATRAATDWVRGGYPAAGVTQSPTQAARRVVATLRDDEPPLWVDALPAGGAGTLAARLF